MIDSNDDNRMAIAHDKPKENELNEAVPPQLLDVKQGSNDVILVLFR